MSEPTDTSAEACAWMADALIGPDWSSERQDRAAALIRALVAERDEERRRAECAEAALEDARTNLAMLEPAAQHADAAVAAALERAARVATNGCLVPPDGGSPTEAEREMCDRISAAIRATIPTTAAAALAEYRRKVLEEAANVVECGCADGLKAAAVSNPPNSAERWNACGAANCGAIDAAAIRALGEAGDA